MSYEQMLRDSLNAEMEAHERTKEAIDKEVVAVNRLSHRVLELGNRCLLLQEENEELQATVREQAAALLVLRREL